MRVVSLFAGIGGIDLGLERAGMSCTWQVEINPYANRVLAKHWPQVLRRRDVHNFPPDPADEWRVDLIAGGFPCQPVSLAGRRKAQDDPRWLWPQFARIVDVLRPRWVFAENVPGLFGAGMGIVVRDLSALGYVGEWDCISAAHFGAPHERDRVWIIARMGHADEIRLDRDDRGRHDSKPENGCVDVPHPGLINQQTGDQQLGWQEGSDSFGSRDRDPIHTNPDQRRRKPHSDSVCERQSVFGNCDQAPWGSWLAEPSVGRVANGVPRRVDRLERLGEAVVPVCAEWIGKRILELDQGSYRK